MVQVLPYIPSFGERLADKFTEAAGNVSSGYFKGQERRNDLQTLEQIQNDENLSPLQRIVRAQSLSPEMRKTFIPALTAFGQQEVHARENELNRQTQIKVAELRNAGKRNPQEKEQADNQRRIDHNRSVLKEAGKTDEEIEQIAPNISEAASNQILKDANKSKFEDKKKALEGQIPPAKKEILQRVFDQIGNVYNEGHLGKKSKVKDIFSPENWAKRKEVDTLVSQFIGELKSLESAGQLSKERFNDILDRLIRVNEPAIGGKPNSTNAEILGFMRAMSTQFGLDPAVLGEQKSPQKKGPERLDKLPSSKGYPEGTVATDEESGRTYKISDGKWVLASGV